MDEKFESKPHVLISYIRSQSASLIATSADFSVTYALVEFFQLWYVLAAASGALLGAMIHFFASRYWAFKAEHVRMNLQMLKYFIVAAGGLLLNTCGVYILTDYLSLNYMYSKVIASLVIGTVYNFTLHRLVVFK